MMLAPVLFRVITSVFSNAKVKPEHRKRGLLWLVISCRPRAWRSMNHLGLTRHTSRAHGSISPPRLYFVGYVTRRNFSTDCSPRGKEQGAKVNDSR